LVISFVLLVSPNPLEIFAAFISFSLAILSASSFAFLAYSCCKPICAASSSAC
jgi:hypothetical protein